MNLTHVTTIHREITRVTARANHPLLVLVMHNEHYITYDANQRIIHHLAPSNYLVHGGAAIKHMAVHANMKYKA